MRPVASGTLKIRALEIPVKLFTAASSRSVSFKLLHAKDLSRIQQKVYCPVDDAIVDRGELVRGFEVEKGRYVTFSDDELKTFEPNSIEVTAFVPAAGIDAIYFDAAYHVGCELTSADAYLTLARAMQESRCAAIAQLMLNGKEHLALIRSFEAKRSRRLMLHTLFYADEVHAADDIDEAARGDMADDEFGLLRQVIAEMGEQSFDPARFSDRYRERVIAAAREKLAGGTLLPSPAPPNAAKPIDLAEQLRQSLSTHRNAAPDRAASVSRRGRPKSRKGAVAK